jgi:PhnB protein
MINATTAYRAVTPYLLVADADAELAFLKSAFGGIEVTCQRGPDRRVTHAEIQIGDSLVMIGQAGGSWKPLGGSQYLWIVMMLTRRTSVPSRPAGATARSAPADKPYGHRVAEVVDANGITWWLAAPVR